MLSMKTVPTPIEAALTPATPGQRLRRALHAWPRETRDTLFLLAVIAWLILPQTPRLPGWCVGLAALVLLWRAALAVRLRPLPGRWTLTAVLAITLALTWWSHKTLLGKEAGVTLIVVLLCLKTLEVRARRDAFVVFFLGFFTLLTNFFASQSLLIAAAMLVGLLGLLTALVQAHMPVGQPSVVQAGGIALRLAAWGTPVMVVLFLLFPRMAPLWSVPSDGITGRSGLSERMAVGAVTRLALDEGVALRVRFAQATPPPASSLYFRGPVLASFDGGEWRSLRSGFPASMQLKADLQVRGAPFDYEITQEPTQRPWLFVIEGATAPPVLPNMDARLTPDLQWLLSRPATELLRFKATSYPEFRHGPLSPLPALQDHVELPPGFNPRTLQLAAQLRRQSTLAQADALAVSAAVLERLRTGGYTYTLEPGAAGVHSADTFWFDTKQGFCEHIASAYVVLMRAMDVPARIVTGYQGGEVNPVDGYWTVRNSDAHAWAEIWQPGQGWLRVDPTASVAPGRIGQSQRLVAPQGALAAVLSRAGWAVNLGATWEALNNRWNQWVLNYTQTQQMNLLQGLGFESPGWEELAWLLIAIVIVASSAGAGWTLLERWQRDPWLRLLGAARTQVGRTGAVVAPQASPADLRRALQQCTPPVDAALLAWLTALETHRYAPHPQPGALAELQRQWRTLRWPRPEAAATAASASASASASAPHSP